MVADGTTETGPPMADTTKMLDNPMDETQRSGGGFLGLMLFPLIAIAAIAFAAYELVG
jgi:hypothetical protein